MKKIKNLTVTTFLTVAVLAGPLAAVAAEKKADKKADNYPLKTCVVSGEKLGEMSEPYVFKHDGKEVKLCCKDCLKDFNKNPAKYMKKLEQAEAKAKK